MLCTLKHKARLSEALSAALSGVRVRWELPEEDHGAPVLQYLLQSAEQVKHTVCEVCNEFV